MYLFHEISLNGSLQETAKKCILLASCIGPLKFTWMAKKLCLGKDVRIYSSSHEIPFFCASQWDHDLLSQSSQLHSSLTRPGVGEGVLTAESVGDGYQHTHLLNTFGATYLSLECPTLLFLAPCIKGILILSIKGDAVIQVIVIS